MGLTISNLNNSYKTHKFPERVQSASIKLKFKLREKLKGFHFDKSKR